MSKLIRDPQLDDLVKELNREESGSTWPPLQVPSGNPLEELLLEVSRRSARHLQEQFLERVAARDLKRRPGGTRLFPIQLLDQVIELRIANQLRHRLMLPQPARFCCRDTVSS